MGSLDQQQVDVLRDVLIYHSRASIKGCSCGWAELGKSWPDHVVVVVQESLVARGPGYEPQR